MVAGLLAACAAADGGPVRIGVAGSFSDPIGLPMKLAAELAAEEINASGGINGRRIELVARDDYADPDSAVFVATDLYDSDVVRGRRPPLLRDHARRRAGLQRRRRTRRGDLALVLLSRGVQRGRAHLPRLSQRSRPRRRAGALGARSPGAGARGSALPQRSVRPRHPADFRRGVRPARRPAPVHRPVSRRQARRRARISIAWHGTSGSSSWWWPATGARPRRSSGRPGAAG